MTQTGPFKSASFRLVLLFTLIVVAISIGALLAQYQSAKNLLETQHSNILKADLDGFSSLYEQRRIVALRQAIEFRSSMESDSAAIFLLRDRDGSKLAGNLEAPPQGMSFQQGLFELTSVQRLTRKTGEVFDMVGRELPGGFTLLVGRSRENVAMLLGQQLWRIVGISFALVLASVVLGWVFVRSVLRRIDRINLLADQVAAGEMAARLPRSIRRDEFSVLEQHINNMLDRISTLHRAILRVSDAIAHELRTPLNRIHQKMDALPEQVPQKMEILSEIRKTVRVFDSLLDISIAESAEGRAQGLIPVNMSLLVQEIVDLYEPLSEEKSLVYSATIQPDLVVLGDRSLLAQMLSNLLDNAIKFTRNEDAITIRLFSHTSSVILRVSDTGPGLPKDIGTAVLEKFVRSERDRGVEGHGLGLALVQAIATRHGAKLRLLEQNIGFAIEISWAKFAQENEES